MKTEHKEKNILSKTIKEFSDFFSGKYKPTDEEINKKKHCRCCRACGGCNRGKL